MTIEVKEKFSENKMPEVGQFWKYSGTHGNTAYLRIADYIGYKLFSFEKDSHFYSIGLNDGCIYHTPYGNDNDTDIIILEPKGGKLVLVEKS